ncbi:MAG: WbqC family protein [Chloroflexi bacterium]|nr:WbqC family protein [Chloroflexota bacterium]
MKRVAIMQPTYLPWLGYFSLMDQVDTFVFLDSVQFNKRSWQQRNRIKTPRGELMLTVPVKTKGRRYQKLCEVEVDNGQTFQHKHLKAMEYSYSKAFYFSVYWDDIHQTLGQDYRYLVDLNIAMIEEFRTKLGIKVELLRSSSLNTEGRNVELLINLCRLLGADSYLSPKGSSVYIEENNLFQKNGIELLYPDYIHPHYRQLYNSFAPYMSILDLLMNEGDRSLDIIRIGQNCINENR